MRRSQHLQRYAERLVMQPDWEDTYCKSCIIDCCALHRRPLIAGTVSSCARGWPTAPPLRAISSSAMGSLTMMLLYILRRWFRILQWKGVLEDRYAWKNVNEQRAQDARKKGKACLRMWITRGKQSNRAMSTGRYWDCNPKDR